MLNCQEFNVTLRKAERDDMVQVYKLIKNHAEFEKLDNQMITDVSVLQDVGFDSKNPAFACIVAELTDGNIIGFALYYYSYSTWVGKIISLENLYVQPAYRRNGVGTQLFKILVNICVEQRIKRIEFHVLLGSPAINFYKRLGAANLTETEKWALFRMDHDALNLLSSL